MDTLPELDSINYITSGGVKIAINEVVNTIEAHKNKINPHGITKETIGLNKIINASMDVIPQENSDNYISSGAVDAAIKDVKLLLEAKEKSLNDSINTKLNKAELPKYLSDFSNDKTNYITVDDIPDNYITEEKLAAKNYLTSVPLNYVTFEELASKKYLTEHQDISSKADKSELSTIAITGS
jgi:hypothetical protein